MSIHWNAGREPNAAALVQRSGALGSVAGGFYEDQDTGVLWYVKFPWSREVARNEVLAAKLYELIGIQVPEVHLVEVVETTAVASRYVRGLKVALPTELRHATGVAEGFAADAWLANWDVAGPCNVMLHGSTAVRIDLGGALRFRGRGEPKGSAFGPNVGEIEGLRDSTINPQAAELFRSIDSLQIQSSIARVLAVDEHVIAEAVMFYGPADSRAQGELIHLLRARRDDLRRRCANHLEPA